MLSTAHRIKQADKRLELHEQAWANMAVQATKKNGKPVYSRFDKFFDYEQAFNEAVRPGHRKRKSNVVSLADKNRRINQLLKKGGI